MMAFLGSKAGRGQEQGLLSWGTVSRQELAQKASRPAAAAGRPPACSGAPPDIHSHIARRSPRDAAAAAARRAAASRPSQGSHATTEGGDAGCAHAGHAVACWTCRSCPTAPSIWLYSGRRDITASSRVARATSWRGAAACCQLACVAGCRACAALWRLTSVSA